MPLPLGMSKTQINKLGDRLAASGEEVSDEDLTQLEALVMCHAAALTGAAHRLRDIGALVGADMALTSRAKTTQTIVEKLQRQRNMSLSRVQDLAGIRLVGAVTLRQQDQLAEAICARFADGIRAPVVHDRRAEPSWGYRAVHVVVEFDGVMAEIQVRTTLQHAWANLMERLADRAGRGIRYGELQGAPQDTRELVQGMMELSEIIYDVEQQISRQPAISDADRGQMDRIAQSFNNLAQKLAEAQH